jgi:hypothetical protein
MITEKKNGVCSFTCWANKEGMSLNNTWTRIIPKSTVILSVTLIKKAFLHQDS